MLLTTLSRMPRRMIARAARLRVPAVAREAQRRRLTYLTDGKFLSLRDAIRETRRRNVAGDFLEFGIALGGSAVYLVSEMGARRFRGYDVFGMIPAPGEHDDHRSKQRYEVIRSGGSKGIGGDPYYGYQDDLFGRVCQTFASFGYPVDGARVALHQGLFEDTVRFAPGDQVALAHVDCDWYDPVRLCLERTADALQPWGFFVLDDYNDYGGARRAVDDFLLANRGFRLVRARPHAVLQKS